ncbi:MAG: hypothetical protein MJ192_03550 [Clostridia bacterium]|nr:hypothetical protein [Clostridia bacterium]
MLCVYDLYDLYAITVTVRFRPENPVNVPVLEQVIGVLNDRDRAGPNRFRAALRSVPGIDRDADSLFSALLTDNSYSYFPIGFLKDERVLRLLITAYEQLLSAVREGNADRIYDLADCLHNLPIMLTEHDFTVPRYFWTIYVSSYRKKWDESFLRAEQKALKCRPKQIRR